MDKRVAMMEGSQYSGYVYDLPLNSDNAPGGIIVYYADGDEEIIHVNQYVVDLFECDSVEDFMAHTKGSFRSFVHAEDIDAAEDSIWGQVGKHDKLDHIYYRIETKSGRLVNVEDFGRLVETSNGRPVFYVFIIEMMQRGTIDWLTGLPSMVRFHELAELGSDAIRGRGEHPVAVALDLVGLKSFNTEYGRAEGDSLLCAFGDVIRKHFGSEACSRFGEDHFYAFSSDVGIDERIASLFDDFTRVNDGKVLPIRAGAYICEPEDDIVAVGFDRAKIACDLDRKTWRSHLMWFDDDMRSETRLRIHLLDHVDAAMSEGWIRPFYQPIVRSSTGNVCGEEALARWIDPEFGPLSPQQFVPVLEEAGLLQKLDLHIIGCVLDDMLTKQDRGVPVVPVSVNVSLRDLRSLDIAAELVRRMDEKGLPHGLIRVEFTESAASSDPAEFKRQVKSLRDSGFKVWMDDFGSGYSSLYTLQEFEFDLVKLDMGLVKSVHSEKSRKIVAGVVSMAAKIGLSTLAEGVETREQAVFLESMGCNMLQGFYYSQPQPLQIVMGRYKRGAGIPRERNNEFEYWNAVGDVDLLDITSNVDGRAVDGTPLSAFPSGVMERRGDTWSLLRANDSYRQFLDNGGAIPLSEPNLQTLVFAHGVDVEYGEAAERSLKTGMWERIAGRMEYGTGLQFYTRPVASTADADAFVLASVPTMLGTALGSFGDVPVAYAVLRVVLNDAGTEVVDAEYVYANEMYCTWCGYDASDIAGRSYQVLSEGRGSVWFPYCYRAAVLGEDVHDVLYGPQVGHWLSFNMAPSPVEGCLVFAFTIVDDEHREREEIIVSRDTSDLIIGIASAFNGEKSYEDSMNDVLEMVSRTVHPERLYIFERGESTTSSTFEWCAEGVESNIAMLQGKNNEDFRTWERLMKRGDALMIPDVSQLQGIDEVLRRRFESHGIKRIMAVPLLNGDELLGFLVADNYLIDEGFDAKRLLETVGPFISARIANHHLMEVLERAGTHDGLTGLLNRRGIDAAIAEQLEGNPEAPFVLALMDVDDFKTLNDKFGHTVGDDMLRALAELVVDMLPAGSIVGRNGGDEFLALLYGESVARADELFGSLSAAPKGCESGGVCYPASLSIGYVEYPLQVDSLKSAYTKADVALYAVKLTGKSGCMRYSPEIETHYRTLLGFSSRDVAENIPGGILVHTASQNSEILFANDELREMLECDSLSDLMEFTGGSSRGFVHPDDWPRVRQALDRQAELGAEGAKGFSNYRIMTKSGKVMRAAANSRLVEVDRIGKVFYVILVNRDERTGA